MRKVVIVTVLFFASILLIQACACKGGSADAGLLSAGDHTRNFTFQDRERCYRIHIPANISKKNVPVILVLHGGGTNAESMEKVTGLNRLADRKGFVVVYPQGTGVTKRLLTWNAGNCCAYAKRKNIDDVGAIRALLKDLKRIVEYDTNRVYATGISNGGMMVYRLGCELSDKIAAIAPIAGNMGVSSCSPSRPVPVVAFHGTQDQNVLFEGGVGPNSVTKTKFNSVESTLGKWRSIDGCGATPDSEKLPDKDGAHTTVVKKTWKNCKNNSEVVLYKIEGGGHTWPGGPRNEWGKMGKVTHDISAAEAMWEFFSRHQLP